MKQKMYITLKNLPQVKAGTIVRLEASGWMFDFGNGLYKSCVYDPQTEPEFFKEYIEFKFKVGDSVYVTEKAAKGFKNLSSKLPVIITAIPTTQNKNPKYNVVQNNIRHIVYEKDLYVADKYYFINSNAQVHQQVLTDEHRISKAYAYRLATNNIYNDHKSATKVLDDLNLVGCWD